MMSPDRLSYPFAIAIHGGAGTIRKSNMTPAREQAYIEGLIMSVNTGYGILAKGGRALDAVQNAVNVMEDSPLFNAGKGAVFTNDGSHEQDACIMDGVNRDAGAIAAVRHIRNPIDLARLVLHHSTHVLLAGDGAETFARAYGMALEDDPKYFDTAYRWEQLQRAIAKEKEANSDKEHTRLDHSDDGQVGTVGAVAVDKQGNLAAATSTGGMTNKRFGRVGDSCLVGAGTYADNATCAVSTTGIGEFFMRAVTAFDIAAMMAYRGLSLTEAAEEAIMERLAALGGTGGVVAIDRAGNVAMPFNSEGMYRAYRAPGGDPVVKIYKE